MAVAAGIDCLTGIDPKTVRLADPDGVAAPERTPITLILLFVLIGYVVYRAASSSQRTSSPPQTRPTSRQSSSRWPAPRPTPSW